MVTQSLIIQTTKIIFFLTFFSIVQQSRLSNLLQVPPTDPLLRTPSPADLPNFSFQDLQNELSLNELSLESSDGRENSDINESKNSFLSSSLFNPGVWLDNSSVNNNLFTPSSNSANNAFANNSSTTTTTTATASSSYNEVICLSRFSLLCNEELRYFYRDTRYFIETFVTFIEAFITFYRDSLLFNEELRSFL